MPNPLDGRIGGPSFAGKWIDRDRSYLVSFITSDPIGSAIEEVHVNFRGYPGRTAIPACEDTLITKSRVVHPRIPCFSDPRRRMRLGDKTVTMYTVNQGVDQWHLLYAWRYRRSLYTVSEHVISPYSYAQVVGNLDRMTRSLVLLTPAR